MYAASVLKAMLGEAVTGVIPEEFLTTDRIMQRWAEANGQGLPTERWDDSRTSRPTPLDDHSAYVMDRLMLTVPKTTERIVVGWYCRPIPTRELARELGMSKRSLEKAHLVTLNYLKWKIEGTNHPTLLKLLRVQVD